MADEMITGVDDATYLAVVVAVVVSAYTHMYRQRQRGSASE
jgi:hypothetical protein